MEQLQQDNKTFRPLQKKPKSENKILNFDLEANVENYGVKKSNFEIMISRYC